MNLVEEFHEFTWDMIRALPRAYYYQSNNIPYQVKCKLGLGPTYYFSSNVEEINEFLSIFI